MICETNSAVMAQHDAPQRISSLKAGQFCPTVVSCSHTLESLGRAAFHQAAMVPVAQTAVTPGHADNVVSNLSHTNASNPPVCEGGPTAIDTEEPSAKLCSGNDERKPIRPQAVAIRGAGPGGSAAGGSAAKTCSAAMAAVALDWRHDSLSNKNCEGSATSDEDHPRLVPRRGAGPELRSGGREIDEYLMRLLHAGSASASEAAMYQNEADSNKGLTSVAFPAGWNNATPWFKAGGAQQAAGAVQGAAGGKRAMPPPAFPAQPWQGSRLGPLPPIGPYSLAVPHLDEATQVQGDSSGIGAVSNGGGNSEGTPSLGQSRERARSTTPLPSSQAQQPLAHQALQVAEATMLTTVRRQMGDAGVAKIGQTMISQQDTLRQQVADLHRLVRRQMALMQEASTSAQTAAVGAETMAKQQGSVDVQDPQTVLLSSLGGGGSGGSGPSSTAFGEGGPSLHTISGELPAVTDAAGTTDGPGGGGVSRETLRVAALAARSQQLRQGSLSVGVSSEAALQGDSKHNRRSLDSNTSEQHDLSSMHPAALATAGTNMCSATNNNVTSQQLQEADAQLRSASLEMSQQGGSPLAAAFGSGGSLSQAASDALCQHAAALVQGFSPRVANYNGEAQPDGGFGDGSAQHPQQDAQQRIMQQQQQQQQQALAQQSFLAAAGQRQFQEQYMFSTGGQQPGSPWCAEVMRRMQQQTCMQAFDPSFFPWLYQSNLAASAMNAAYNMYNASGIPGSGPTGWWQQSMGFDMMAMGGHPNFGQPPQGAKPSQPGQNMCGKYGMQQGQAEQGASADGAASEESARLSSHNKQQSPPPAAASHPHGASGGSPPTEDEATSSLSHRKRKR